MNIKDSSILVVEDSSAQREEYVRMLRELEATDIVVANDGVQALDILIQRYNEKKSINVVLMDYEMPNMNGLELLNKIRGNADLYITPVVYMSSRGDFEVVTKFIKAGVNQMIVKPFNKIELADRLNKALKNNKA